MRAVRNRMFLSSMVISVVLAVGLWPAAAGTAAAASAMSATEAAERQSPAGMVVAALTGPDPESALQVMPPDFEVSLGYRPHVAGGVPRNPTGSCSSPIPLPDRFEDLCKTHDFGYDLLRYADRHGAPLGSWARTSLDTMLVDAMHDSCTAPTCHWAADLTRIGLAFNTWRQHDGAPVNKESVPAIVLTSILRGGESLASLVGLS